MTTLDMLLQEEKKLGRSRVEHACKQYLKLRTRAGVIPTPRKKIPRAWVLEAWDKQRSLCARCGKYITPEDLVGDHRIPIIDGGKHARSNIAAMHGSCNSAKGANDLVTESKRTGRTITEMLPE